LGILRQQQKHYDIVVQKKKKPDTSLEIQKRMEFGTLNEIDALATLTAKVLPFLFPDLDYFEEGCQKVCEGTFESFLVVSPDGSLRDKNTGDIKFMYENKCKSPDSFSPNAYYTIPEYYVLQILCEMKAYNCCDLLFTCWSEESLTLYHAQFDDHLWTTCWNELVRLYGINHTRPTRFAPVVKDMKDVIKEYVQNKVILLGEFPACSTLKLDNLSTDSAEEPYSKPKSRTKPFESTCLSTICESLVIVKCWMETSYNLCRTVASEILVFMLSDLDQVYQTEFSNAYPITYALKGPSMSLDVRSHMIKEVLNVCENYNVNFLATSSDGQWHNYGVRDEDGKPLTMHQLAKDHWRKEKATDKSTMISKLKET